MSLEGLKDVEKRLNTEIEKIKGATLSGLLEAGLLIKAEAQALTPVVTGNLRNSAFVNWSGGSATYVGKFRNPKGRKGVKEQRQADRASVIPSSHSRILSADVVMVEIGFSAAYATIVHENPRAGKTGGFAPSAPESSKPRSLTGGRGVYPPGTYSKVGQWKFLETALKENTGRVLEIIRREASGK